MRPKGYSSKSSGGSKSFDSVNVVKKSRKLTKKEIKSREDRKKLDSLPRLEANEVEVGIEVYHSFTGIVTIKEVLDNGKIKLSNGMVTNPSSVKKV